MGLKGLTEASVQDSQWYMTVNSIQGKQVFIQDSQRFEISSVQDSGGEIYRSFHPLLLPHASLETRNVAFESVDKTFK